MFPYRLRCLLLFLLLLLLSPLSPAADYPDSTGVDAIHSSIVPVSHDMIDLAQQARAKQVPLLMVFSAADCEYCHLLEREILDPMFISKDYRDKVVIRRVMTDSLDDVRNFQGEMISAGEFSRHYRIRITPTVVLLDYDGKQLAPPVLGINTVEMYSAYLDRAIELSLNQLRN